MSDPAREIERLRRILEVSRQLAATIDLDVLLRVIVEAACDVLDCERATIFLYDPQRDELYSRVASGGEEIRFQAHRGIAGAAAAGRVMINVPDAYADPRFNPDVDRRTGFLTRNLLTFPLESFDGQLVGVLQALNKRRGPFDAEDEELARVLSAQAGVALHRQRLLEEYAAKQRMARDLDIARQIQQACLPRGNPSVGGYEIAGWNRSAEQTGGDCYDFIALPQGRLGLFLADATGHGIGAALVIAQCRSLVRAMLSVTADLRQVVAHVNALLAEDLTDERFVTAFLGILDPRRHVLEYISSGQGPLLFFSPSAGGGPAVEVRPACSVPLAVAEDVQYDPPQQWVFRPGSLLALLTDGFFEAVGPEDELFGQQRVIDLLATRLDHPLETLVAELHEQVRRFCGPLPQSDDLTAVLVRRRPPGLTASE